MERISMTGQRQEHKGTEHQTLIRQYTMGDDDGDYANVILELHPMLAVWHFVFTRTSVEIIRKFREVAYDNLVKPILIEKLKYHELYFWTNDEKLIRVIMGNDLQHVGEVGDKKLWKWEFYGR
jgi:hypothetical protein